MAGKRSATSELNHDNWDEDVEPEEAGKFSQADENILKGRVIKKAKRRGIQPAVKKYLPLHDLSESESNELGKSNPNVIDVVLCLIK